MIVSPLLSNTKKFQFSTSDLKGFSLIQPSERFPLPSPHSSPFLLRNFGVVLPPSLRFFSSLFQPLMLGLEIFGFPKPFKS